jgi:hypothetical protein
MPNPCVEQLKLGQDAGSLLPVPIARFGVEFDELWNRLTQCDRIGSLFFQRRVSELAPSGIAQDATRFLTDGRPRKVSDKCLP